MALEFIRADTVNKHIKSVVSTLLNFQFYLFPLSSHKLKFKSRARNNDSISVLILTRAVFTFCEGGIRFPLYFLYTAMHFPLRYNCLDHSNVVEHIELFCFSFISLTLLHKIKILSPDS